MAYQRRQPPQHPQQQYPQQYQQPYPPQYQPPPGHQFHYVPGAGSKTALIVLSILCVVLAITTIALFAMVNNRSDELNQRTDKLAEAQKEIKDMREKGAYGQLEALAVKQGQAEPTDVGYWKNRAKYLERELSAAEKEAMRVRQYLPPEVAERLKQSEDLAVENVKVTTGSNGLKINFSVVNRATKSIPNVIGNILFWQGDQISQECPFTLTSIAARTTVPMTLEAPIVRYTHYNGYVKANKSNE